jgi:hypothetical protein
MFLFVWIIVEDIIENKNNYNLGNIHKKILSIFFNYMMINLFFILLIKFFNIWLI